LSFISDIKSASITEVAKVGQELANIAQTLQGEIDKVKHINM